MFAKHQRTAAGDPTTPARTDVPPRRALRSPRERNGIAPSSRTTVIAASVPDTTSVGTTAAHVLNPPASLCAFAGDRARPTTTIGVTSTSAAARTPRRVIGLRTTLPRFVVEPAALDLSSVGPDRAWLAAASPALFETERVGHRVANTDPRRPALGSRSGRLDHRVAPAMATRAASVRQRASFSPA